MGISLAAMGYLTLGRRFLNNKHDIIDDRIDVTIRGMQGLTIDARCHDHKFDPIPAADYYFVWRLRFIRRPGNEPSNLRLLIGKSLSNRSFFFAANSGNRGDRVPRGDFVYAGGRCPVVLSWQWTNGTR
ncbi:MAG: DUF1549 domain-containing protein [Planctomycetaceae bacterium]